MDLGLLKSLGMSVFGGTKELFLSHLHSAPTARRKNKQTYLKTDQHELSAECLSVVFSISCEVMAVEVEVICYRLHL